MTQSFRIIVVAACFVLSNLSLQADDCTQRWECRRMSIDTAECWLRVGPNSSKFKEALTCRGECQCMPDSSTGSLACNCECYYTYCYEV